MNAAIVLATSDSSAAFSAAEVAIDFARALDATLHAVCVIEPGELGRRLDGPGRPTRARLAVHRQPHAVRARVRPRAGARGARRPRALSSPLALGPSGR